MGVIGALFIQRRCHSNFLPDPLFSPGSRSCLELTQQAATWIEDARLAQRIMNFAIAYAYTVKQILRRERLFAEDLDGIVDADEVRAYEHLMCSVACGVIRCHHCCCCCWLLWSWLRQPRRARNPTCPGRAGGGDQRRRNYLALLLFVRVLSFASWLLYIHSPQ